MRRTVRPFVKEFKTRWSKSSKSRTAEPCPDKPHFLQPFPTADETAPAPNREDEDYLAALKAADAAFGMPHQIASKGATSLPHVGRVLPSLVEEPLPDPVRSSEPKQKALAKRKAPSKNSSIAKVKKSAPTVKRKAAAPSQTASAKSLIAIEPQSRIFETSTDTASRREAKSIRKRWVQKSELGPGEKWKRRLSKHAR